MSSFPTRAPSSPKRAASRRAADGGVRDGALRSGLVLVTGGCRSGKSAFAESLFPGGRKLYLATAEVRDAGMRQRVDAHQARRGPEWETVEEAHALADVFRRLQAHSGQWAGILVECLSFWVHACLERGDAEAEILSQAADLTQAARPISRACPVVFVSSETGLGICPATESGNQFRDALGLVNQHAAQAADAVILVVAGLPLALKGAVPVPRGL